MTQTISNMKTGHYTERIFGPDLVLHQARQAPIDIDITHDKRNCKIFQEMRV
jgi:hypothetical protein